MCHAVKVQWAQYSQFNTPELKWSAVTKNQAIFWKLYWGCKNENNLAEKVSYGLDVWISDTKATMIKKL